MAKKPKINRKEIEKLKPLVLESKIKSEKPKEEEKKAENLEDDGDESEEEQFNPIPSSFTRGFSGSSRAPVLEKIESKEDSLEREISNTPMTSQTPMASAHKEITYVQNLPKYSGSDYSARSNYEMNEDRDTRTDKQVNIARAREFNAAAMPRETQSINMGLWQRENVFNRPDVTRDEDDRDYVLHAKEKKERDKLPFQS
jgi:hypothetical protein